MYILYYYYYLLCVYIDDWPTVWKINFYLVHHAVHDTVLVHRMWHALVPDSPDHRQSFVPQTENRKLCAGTHIGRIDFHYFLRHVFGETGRLPVGAHQDTTKSHRQQNIPQPLHTDAHESHAVLCRHDDGLGTAQDEKHVLQNQQSAYLFVVMTYTYYSVYRHTGKSNKPLDVDI